MIVVAGLGPGELDRVPDQVRALLLDPSQTVVVRTLEHPAAQELARLRALISCDDLYLGGVSFEDVYGEIVSRLTSLAERGPVVYAVPGSPLVGELAVRDLLESGADVKVIPGESFLDAVLLAVGYDPLDRGLQILNGHDLPRPLILDKPTVIAQLDRPEILAEVASALARVLPDETNITIVTDAGGTGETITKTGIDEVDPALAGYRTSVFVDAEPGGLVGAVRTMRRLREECPWDREQTHQSLMKNLVEETYELVETVARLGMNEAEDWAVNAALEDELGDVLLQVLFHAAIAEQDGLFDIDDVAEVMRHKLVRRHPHVFGEVVVDSAAEVKANWDRIKEQERGQRGSIVDGVPTGMPALYRASKLQNRAAKVGFDWSHAEEVIPKLSEEIAELTRAVSGDGDTMAELGDLLFSAVNVARHLGVDPEIALQRANDRFVQRLRRMETEGPLTGEDLEALNDRWERAKSE